MPALASLLLAGQAIAQVSVGQGPVSGNSVTLFGIVDVAVAYGTGSIAHTTQLVSGADTPSRLGFRGTENLGGGLGVGFWLEAGLNVDDGTGVPSNTNNQPSGVTSTNAITFNRRSTVSLIDRWGELRLGRDFTATYRNRDQVDPFNGVGSSQTNVGSLGGTTGMRASNMVGYFLPPNLAGFFGEAQYFMGENASISPSALNPPNHNDGNGYAARIGWASGPFGVAVAVGDTQFARTATTGNIKVVNVGAACDFSFFKLTAGYFRDKVERFVAVTGSGYIVGATIPLGLDLVKVSWSSYGTDELFDPRARKFAIGYEYNFSKRTAAYATYAHLSNSGGSSFALNGSITGPSRNSQGYDFGLRHSF
jgi:predicted porin